MFCENCIKQKVDCGAHDNIIPKLETDIRRGCANRKHTDRKY